MPCSKCEQKRKEMHAKLLEAYMRDEGIDNIEGVSPKQLHIFKRKLRIAQRDERIKRRNLRKQNLKKKEEGDV
jgi:C4-type Zn-finger protein